MAIARGLARPWIANTFLVIMALVFSVCGGSLTQALDVRAQGQLLQDDIHRFVPAPCLGPRVSAPEVTKLMQKGRRYRATITCTYTADGIPHDATSEFNLLARYREPSDALARGQRWIAEHQPLTAYYDPVAPGHATLSRDISYEVGSDIVFSIAGIVIALALWFMIVRKLFLRLQQWRAARRKSPPDEPIPSARVV